MTDRSRYTTLIFDFDGTIADTLEATRGVYNEIASEQGYRSIALDEVETLRKFSIKQLIAELNIPKLKVPSLLANGLKRMRSRVAGLPLIDGMEPVLREMHSRSLRLGILTSNSTENVQHFLEVNGLGHLFEFISSTSRLNGKAKHLRSIARTFSLEKGEMIYIGDELRDVKASKKAEVPIAAVNWGFNAEESLIASEPTYLIRQPQQLLDLI